MPYQKKWSVSRLKAIEECPMWYYFSYVDKDKRNIPRRPQFAFGDLCHSLMERAWTGKDNTFLYKTPQSFFKVAKRLWYKNFVYSETDNRGEVIDWQFEGQPHVMARQLKKATRSMYYKYRNAPRPAFQELTLESRIIHSLGDRKLEIELLGKIDAIEQYTRERGLLITDYKTDMFNPGRARLEWDPQPTVYLLLTSLALRNDPEFRKQLNYPEELIESTPETTLILPELNVQFDLLRRGESFQMQRTDRDVQRVLATIMDKMTLIEEENYVRSEGTHCLRCMRRERCDTEKEEGLHIQPGKNPQIEIFPIKPRKPKSRKRPQKSFRFPKNEV